MLRKFKLLDGAVDQLESTERDDLRAELDARFALMAGGSQAPVQRARTGVEAEQGRRVTKCAMRDESRLRQSRSMSASASSRLHMLARYNRAAMPMIRSACSRRSRARPNATRSVHARRRPRQSKCNACAIRVRDGSASGGRTRRAPDACRCARARVSGDRFVAEHRDWLAAQLAHYTRPRPRRWSAATTASLAVARRARCRCIGRTAAMPRLQRDGDTGCCSPCPARAGEAALQRALRDFYEGEARADVGRWLPRYLPSCRARRGGCCSSR